ncbi:potassium channel family protein [Actinospongicola halichondriae]|uniref:potassium channel family protein n=1 Tax=Actinospongicola halichondriae TaxID=3236844 RepID=UPI003D3754F2
MIERWRRRRRQGRLAAAADPWHRFRVGLALLGGVLALGTVGYMVLGLGLFDAVYQTAITITTVGYAEVGVENVDATDYRAFTLALVLLGAGTAVFTVSVLMETLVEGSLNDGLRRRRMSKNIEAMADHVIVVGWGRVGRSIAAYATRHGAEVVVVDRNADLDTGDLPSVAGDALDDDTLVAAGIERASVLIAALETDGGNLALTLTARSLQSELFLVARTADQRNERKFFQAGADRVVNPHEIGGSRMGALAMHPTVAEFLDEVLHDDGHDVEIIEVPVPADSPLIGTPIGDLSGSGARALVLAVRSDGGSYLANPGADVRVGAGDVLIALGSHAQVRDLRSATLRRRALRFRGSDVEV